MIERMYKIAVVCLEEDRRQSLKALRSLGTVHVVPTVPPSSDMLDDLRRKQAEVEQLLAYLGSLKISAKRLQALTDGKIQSVQAGEAVFLDVLENYMRMRSLQTQIGELKPQVDQLESWGNFDWSILHDLEAKGWHWAMCSVRRGTMPKMPEGCQWEVVGSDSMNSYIFAVSEDSLDELEGCALHFKPGVVFSDLESEMLMLAAKESEAYEHLEIAVANHMPALEKYRSDILRKIRFQIAYAGMGRDCAQLAYLQGYVPAGNLDGLKEAATANGWALQYEEVVEDDAQVPTKLDIPKPFRMSQLIFDFIGVLPGYNESDVSIPVMIFLTLFCGMLVGDAGYGALAMVATGICWLRAKTEKGNDGSKLLFIMSSCIFVWGALCGNWFGWNPGQDAGGLLTLLKGLPSLSGSSSSHNIQYVSFFIGAVQLSLAHFCQAVKGRSVKTALGNLGWAIFLWANFFVIQMLLLGGTFGMLPKTMYCVAAVLILAFSINWGSAGDVLYMPFQFINSVVDVMSYIRLYAVGLSGMCIAQCFNDMSSGIMQSGAWYYAVPAAILVGVLGHSLNIALCCMGVLVHGIRLNTLEFSGHAGLEWGGRSYRPLN